VEDYRENIIFVGGIYDNDIDNKENGIEGELMNLQYNITKNTVEKSDVKYEDISFSEKAFFPIDDKTSFILPNFNRRSPKIVYFYKDKNLLETKIYHPNSHLKKKLNKVKTTQLKPIFNGLNFDMPSPKNINSNNERIIINNIDNVDNINNIEYNKNNNIVNSNNEQMDNYKTINNNKNRYTDNLKIENMRIASIHSEEKKHEMNNNISNIEKKDEDEEEEIKNIDIDVIDSQKNDKENIEIKISEEQKNKGNDGVVMVKNKKEKNSKKSSHPEEEEKNNFEDEILPKNKEEDKEKNEEKKEEVNNEKKSEKEENKEDVKQKKETKNEILSGIVQPQSRNKKKIKMFYIEKPRSLTNFHSSLGSPFNNSSILVNGNKMKKQIKIRNIILPKNYSLKSIKKQVRKINRMEINEFGGNANY
jgi:hypothetical protein